MADIAYAVLRFLAEGFLWLGLQALPVTPEMLELLGDRQPQRETVPAPLSPLSPIERALWADLLKRLG